MVGENMLNKFISKTVLTKNSFFLQEAFYERYYNED